MRSLLVSLFVATAFVSFAIAQTPVAYVYVAQTEPALNSPIGSQPVYVYAVDAAGKLTLVSGSPFTNVAGQLVGVTPSHLIARGYQGDLTGGLLPLNELYSYAVSSNGAIGQQQSQIDTQSYSGSNCQAAQGADFPEGAELDHSGKYVYVTYCDNAVQTYALSSSGNLTFQNATIYNNPNGTVGLPKLTGNDSFGYNQTVADSSPVGPVGTFAAFQRTSDGSLQYIGIPSVTGPSLPVDYYPSFGGIVTNDPTNHLAAMLTVLKFTAPNTTTNVGCALASYTAGSQGQLTSTNTYASMPHVCGQSMILSPSGTVLALLSLDGTTLQLFHFNGAANISSAFAQVKGTSGWFTKLAWDKNNHLYALNGLSGRLHVYTVGASSVTEAAGSPYNVPYCGYDTQENMPNCSQSLIVRSAATKACAAPSSNGVNVCSPANGASVGSPVSVEASATISGGVYRFELWSNGSKLLTERDSGTMNESVPLSPGNYHLVFNAYNAAGVHATAIRDITVK